MKNLKVLTALFSALLIATAFQSANAQYDDGLPMQDSFGGGVYGLEPSGSSTGFSTPTTTYRPPAQTNRQTWQQPRSQFVPQTTSISPQQIQNIANAAAALGPAIQQARANLQQIRAQNGGYLIPRNNNGGLQGFRNNQQPIFQGRPLQRFTDTFGYADAQRVRQGLIGSGYRNVQISGHHDNARRVRQGLPRIFGVYHR